MQPEIVWRTATEVLGGFTALLVIILIVMGRRLAMLSAELSDKEFQNRSLSTTYGRITEQCLTVRKLHLNESGLQAYEA